MNNIERALEALANGQVIILVDDADRENEGDFVLAAEKVTPEWINFMTIEARGLICLSMQSADFERLQIPMMTSHNRSAHQTAFGASIEAAVGVSTGISAADRAHTIRVAIDEKSTPADIVMPGHIFPLKARSGGIIERMGHTEGSVDLVRMAGLKPAAVICEIMNPDGSMARLPDLQQLSKEKGYPLVTMRELLTYRWRHEVLVNMVAEAQLPVDHLGSFQIKVFYDALSQQEHLALIKPSMQPEQAILVRIHSACVTGDVFGSLRCDCGAQRSAAMKLIAEQGGVFLYLNQEGRGIGLGNKIKAYALQETGLDTVEANQQLGFLADERDYGVASQILKQLGVTTIRLLTNNPDKVSSLELYGIYVQERLPLEIEPNQENINYMKTKKKKLGHILKNVGES